MTDYRLISIEMSDLSATDLRQEAANLVRGGVVPREEVEDVLLHTSTQEPFRQHPALAYRLEFPGFSRAADVLVATEACRVGIAWGADAEWGDLRDRCDLTTVEGGDRYAVALDAAVHDWFYDQDAWEARR
jgi:hypothetical protein